GSSPSGSSKDSKERFGVKDFRGPSDKVADRGADKVPDKGTPVAQSAYDEGLTKYLPEGTNRIEVMDFEAARSNQLLALTLKGLLLQSSFGTWDHKQQGIGVLKQAGIAEDSVKSMTLVRMQEARDPVVFLRFS